MRALRFAGWGVGWAAAALMALAVLGCVATESPVEPRGVPVSRPPPAMRAEAPRPPPPSAASVWIDGYWHWNGMQYAWIPGHWENASPGTTWAAPRYTSTTDGAYFYEPGTWKPASSANALR